MRTIFYKVNGENRCTDLSYEILAKLETVENLVNFLKKHYNTNDVIFEGFGDA